MLKSHLTSKFITVFVAIVASTSSANAQGQGARIDRELAGKLDFRDPGFAACLQQESCVVNGVTVTATRLTAAGETVPANIYWDPVDGLGVMDGGQNDEIDFDETLTVKFQRPVSVSGVWLSDLYQSEAPRYGARVADGDGSEVGRYELRRGGTSRSQVIVNSEAELPARTFNTEVAPSLFKKEGDLLQRVVVRDGNVTLVSASGRKSLGAMGGSNSLIDADKQELFAGLPTVEIDTQRLLALIEGVVLFPAGEENADRVAGLASNGSALASLHQSSMSYRATSDLSNGEVASYLDAPISSDEIVFTAPFSTSNEFSVSGVIVLP